MVVEQCDDAYRNPIFMCRNWLSGITLLITDSVVISGVLLRFVVLVTIKYKN